MNAAILILAAATLVVVWLVWSLRWTAKQSLVGTWVTTLSDGSHVTLQFEGTPAGGLYKQLTERNGVLSREIGHWSINLLKLRMIIMATDCKEHPRFGVDSEYWVAFKASDKVTINGPERPKWVLERANPEVRLDFDQAKI